MISIKDKTTGEVQYRHLQKLLIIDVLKKKTHQFYAQYNTLPSDAILRYDLVSSPDYSHGFATIKFTTLSSGRKVRTINIYAQHVDSDTSSPSSNNSSVKLLQSVFGN